MRIIGGEFRSRKIRFPEQDTVRPTKDRIREAVFNMIADNLAGSKVLDLFAGSGAYGLEAISRGSGPVSFVDNDIGAVNCINDNIADLDIVDKASVINADAIEAIKALADNNNNNNNGFDIIFADPPFNMDLAKKTLITVSYYDILNRLGLLIVEHSSAERLEDIPNNITLLKEKTYGDIIISVFIAK